MPYRAYYFSPETAERALEFIRFASYFAKMRVSEAIGFRRSAYPLDLKWRWQHWKQIQQHMARRDAGPSDSHGSQAI